MASTRSRASMHLAIYLIQSQPAMLMAACQEEQAGSAAAAAAAIGVSPRRRLSGIILTAVYAYFPLHCTPTARHCTPTSHCNAHLLLTALHTNCTAMHTNCTATHTYFSLHCTPTSHCNGHLLPTAMHTYFPLYCTLTSHCRAACVPMDLEVSVTALEHTELPGTATHACAASHFALIAQKARSGSPPTRETPTRNHIVIT